MCVCYLRNKQLVSRGSSPHNIVVKCSSAMNVPQCSTAQTPSLVQLGFCISGDAYGPNWLS